MRNRSGRKDIEVSRKRDRGTQEERDRSTQLSVLKVFSVAQTPTDSPNWIGKRRGKEEIELF